MSTNATGADLIQSADLWFPLVVIENIYVFPGIPHLLRKKFEGVRERFKGQRFFLRQIFMSCMESDIAQELQDVLDEFPGLMLGSYPKLTDDGYHTLLTLESHDADYVNRAVDSLLARIPQSQLIRVE